jgi:hypothetical protein
MPLTKNEKLVLEYNYKLTIGVFTISECVILLNLESRGVVKVRKEQTCSSLIRPVVTNIDGTY